MPDSKPDRRLPRTVVVLGFVSFFNDFASDMVIPLIPIFLATVLGAGPVALGLIEGVADAVASLLKLWSGRHSDVMQGRRKGLAVAGYSLSNIARPLLGLAGSWVAVLLLRSVDRVGKGLRSAPRDAMVADAVPPDMRGHAFGFHRALDNGGAVLGGLAAAAVLAWSPLTLSQVILLSAVPGVLAVLTLAVGVKEPPHPAAANPAPLPPLAWGAVPAGLRRYLLVLVLFMLARTSETFILLRGYELGMSTVHLLLLWAALNLAKALTATVGGKLGDRVGHGPLLLLAWGSFAASYALFSLAGGAAALWAVSLVYGLLTGLAEGAERAVVSDFAGPAERGTAFGWYHLAVGLAAIPGGLLFGVIWQQAGAPAAFAWGATLAALAAVLLRAWAWPGRKAEG